VTLFCGLLAHRRWARYVATEIHAAVLLSLTWTAIDTLVTGRWDTPWPGTLLFTAIGLYCTAVLVFCLSPAGRRLLAC
jgi:hypothetical protein